jgi:hypothetical protein
MLGLNFSNDIFSKLTNLKKPLNLADYKRILKSRIFWLFLQSWRINFV